MNHDDYFNTEKTFQCTECAAPLSPAFVQWPRDANRAVHPSPTLCNKCCPRVLIEALFLTKSGAAGAIDELRAAGYDVLVADHIADPANAETVFIEVYGRIDRKDADIEARAFAAGAKTPAVDALWKDVERIMGPFGGWVDGDMFIDDDDVPFSGYY